MISISNLIEGWSSQDKRTNRLLGKLTKEGPAPYSLLSDRFKKRAMLEKNKKRRRAYEIGSINFGLKAAGL